MFRQIEWPSQSIMTRKCSDTISNHCSFSRYIAQLPFRQSSARSPNQFLFATLRFPSSCPTSMYRPNRSDFCSVLKFLFVLIFHCSLCVFVMLLSLYLAFVFGTAYSRIFCMSILSSFMPILPIIRNSFEMGFTSNLFG